MDIYQILITKPHNLHFVKRYVKFIESRKSIIRTPGEKLTEHHICPRAEDLFPEYIDFKMNPWNKSVLTLKEHKIAHLMIWKMFRQSVSVIYSANMLTNFHNKQTGRKISTKLYENLSNDFSEQTSKNNSVKLRAYFDDPTRYTPDVKQKLSDRSSKMHSGKCGVYDTVNQINVRVSTDDVDYDRYIPLGILRDEESRNKTSVALSDRVHWYHPTLKPLFLKSDEIPPEGYTNDYPEYLRHQMSEFQTEARFWYNEITKESTKHKIKPDGEGWICKRADFGQRGNPFTFIKHHYNLITKLKYMKDIQQYPSSSWEALFPTPVYEILYNGIKYFTQNHIHICNMLQVEENVILAAINLKKLYKNGNRIFTKVSRKKHNVGAEWENVCISIFPFKFHSSKDYTKGSLTINPESDVWLS
jgi:hypothetical protein